MTENWLGASPRREPVRRGPNYSVPGGEKNQRNEAAVHWGFMQKLDSWGLSVQKRAKVLQTLG